MPKTFASDYEKFEGIMELRHDGKSVMGKWVEALGNDQAISGTWRDGYLELTFSGEWRDLPKSTPIPAAAVLAGWIDGDSAAGRMKVEGRADGPWTATREVAR